MPLERIILAKPRGFCAGVDRAIDIVEQALRLFGAPVYVRKEIVHNPHVVNRLKAKGALFVEELDEVPPNSTTIFSAHGVSPEVHSNAQKRNLSVIDATCPLVTKVHFEAKRFAKEGYTILLIGHEGHDEVIGTMGEAPEAIRLVQTVEDAQAIELTNPERVAVITQTTLSMDDTRSIFEALKARFPTLQIPAQNDICYATQNRQNAVKEIAEQAEVVLVIGATNSSNSVRLTEVARAHGSQSYLINDASEIQDSWIEGKRVVALTSGASAPEDLVQAVVAKLQCYGSPELIEYELVREDVTFSLPKELEDAKLVHES